MIDLPPERIEEGDVITYERPGSDRLVTHRVVEVVERDGTRHFRTKGDANEEPDPRSVPASDVEGRVAFSLPLLGWVLVYAGSRYGTVALVVVPTALLVASELASLIGAKRADSGADED